MLVYIHFITAVTKNVRRLNVLLTTSAIRPARRHVTYNTNVRPNEALGHGVRRPTERAQNVCIFSARQHAERAICYRKSVCLSVRHTGGSVKNG